MTFVEFIGFLISFIAVVFLFIKNFKETRHRLNHPDNQEDSLEDERLEYFEEEQQPSSSKFAHMPPPPPQPVLKREPSTRKKNLPSYYKSDYVEPSLSYHKYKGKDEAHYEDRILSKQFQASGVIANDYQVTGSETNSRGANYIKGMKSRREMLIMKEIFDKPLSMRNLDDSII